MMPTHVNADYLQERVREADREEKVQTELRAFGRESSVFSLFTCLLGVVALSVCFLSGFDLSFRMSPVAEIAKTSDGSVLRTTYEVLDLTPAFVGLAAAGFAANIMIFGGTLLQLKRVPSSSAYTLVLAAVASALGLLFLVLAGY